jgi:hypothetical protein
VRKILIALALVFARPLSAANLYSIRGIKVEAAAESPSAAKDYALSYARRDAVRAAIRRLLMSPDAAKAELPSDYNAEKFVRSIRIYDEKVGASSYSASIDVELTRALVASYIKSLGLNPIEITPPDIVLVAPEPELAMRIIAASESDKGNASVFALSDMPYGDAAVIVRDGRILFADGSEESYADNGTEQAARKIVEKINDHFKGRTLALSTGDSLETTLVFMIRGLDDWIRKESRAKALAELKSMTATAMSSTKVQAKVSGPGANAIAKALAGAGFNAEIKAGYILVKE